MAGHSLSDSSAGWIGLDRPRSTRAKPQPLGMNAIERAVVAPQVEIVVHRAALRLRIDCPGVDWVGSPPTRGNRVRSA